MDPAFWITFGVIGHLVITWITVMVFIALDGPGGNDDPIMYLMAFCWPLVLVVALPVLFCKTAFWAGKRIHENRNPPQIESETSEGGVYMG